MHFLLFWGHSVVTSYLLENTIPGFSFIVPAQGLQQYRIVLQLFFAVVPAIDVVPIYKVMAIKYKS